MNIKSHQNKYLSFIFIMIFNIINLQNLFATEKIGNVVKIQNNAYVLSADGDKILLNLYDSIYLNDRIITDDRSSLVIQYLDNSTIIMKKSTSIKVTDFSLTAAKNLFLAIIDKGSAIIESGKIAKNSNNKMEIKLATMTLGIRGTRFNMGQKEDGSYDIGLSEDSFGNVGTINVSSAGTVKTLYDPKQVISINSDKLIERPQTDLEKNALDEVTQNFVDVKIINEEDIQKNLESQLFNGKIIDANNDGQIDSLDIDVIRENIVATKQETIDFIVENSKEDNINFLSNVLNQSDEKNVGQSIDKIFETKNDLVTGVLTGLSNTNNKFITSSDSEKNNEIKEKIFTQLLSGSEQTKKKSKNIELMSKIITKSDVKSIESIVDIVKTSNASEANSNLSLQILSSVADRQNEEGVELENEEQTQVNRLIEEAVASAAANNNAENSALIANVITKSDVETITQVVDTIKKNNTQNPNAGLSLEVVTNIESIANNDSMTIEPNKQTQINRLLEEAIAAAAAEEAMAEEAAATFATAQAAALAAQQAADLLAQQIADEIAQDSLDEAERLQRIADGLFEQCSAAGANVIAMQLAQSSAEQNAQNAEISVVSANAAWVEASNIIINFVSPVTKAEWDNFELAQNNVNNALDLLNQRNDEAQVAQENSTTAAIQTTNAQTNKTSICAKADAAQTAADEALSVANSATTN